MAMNDLIVLAFSGGFAVGIFIACVIYDRRAKRQEKKMMSLLSP